MENEPGWNSGDYQKYSLENPADRLAFIRKVYVLLSSQLLVTSLFVLIAAFSEGFRDFVYEYWWIMIISCILAIIPLLILFLSKNMARLVPVNYVLLFSFTLLESFTVACICAFYDPFIILLAACCTAGLTCALTVYAMLTKTDFTKTIGFMICLGFALFVLSILLIFFDHQVYRLVFCPLAILFYGVYLIIDTQLVMGNKKYGLGYDDYVLGVVLLYTDIIGIFTYLLALLDN